MRFVLMRTDGAFVALPGRTPGNERPVSIDSILEN